MTIPHDLLTALRTLNAENVGDFIYDIREREGLGWDGPRVKAWSDAAGTIARYVEQHKPLVSPPPREWCERTPGCLRDAHDESIPCDTEVPF